MYVGMWRLGIGGKTLGSITMGVVSSVKVLRRSYKGPLSELYTTLDCRCVMGP